MKIVLLEGSPNPNGSTHLLAESFANGARETGHTVTVVEAAHAAIHPCTGCIRCGYEGPCAQKDEMETIRPMILQADMLVFCHAALLLWHVGAVEDPDRPFLLL